MIIFSVVIHYLRFFLLDLNKPVLVEGCILIIGEEGIETLMYFKSESYLKILQGLQNCERRNELGDSKYGAGEVLIIFFQLANKTSHRSSKDLQVRGWEGYTD